MLMDYVEGSNLEVLRRQQSNKRFSVQQVLSIMAPIMNAVSYLHNQKLPIIHRDIKPSNIIVPPSRNEAVLVDFGIAKEFDPDSTTTSERHASPGYAAPEQYGTGTNTRTDIYGLGATMYTLLTGVVPADAFFRTTILGSGKNVVLLSKLFKTIRRHDEDQFDLFPSREIFLEESLERTEMNSLDAVCLRGGNLVHLAKCWSDCIDGSKILAIRDIVFVDLNLIVNVEVVESLNRDCMFIHFCDKFFGSIPSTFSL